MVYKMEGSIQTCDVHKDNQHALCGGSDGLDMWNITTGAKICSPTKPSRCHVKYAKFLTHLEQIIYVADGGRVHLVDMNGTNIRTLDTVLSVEAPVLKLFNKDTFLAIAEQDTTFRVFDLRTGEILYAFLHGSAGFLDFGIHSKGNTILARNRNGYLYKFEKLGSDQFPTIMNDFFKSIKIQ